MNSSITPGLRRRDPRAMEELYNRLGRQAFGLAYRMLGDSQSAEHVVQDTFLSVWRSAERLDSSREKVQSYVLTVVHRRAIDVLRSRKAPIARLGDNPSEIRDDSPDVTETVAIALDPEAVRAALGDLPNEQLRVVEMAYFQGLTHVEIAEGLSLPLGTVKSRLRLALEKIRADLLRYER